jgi:hypothetical protein
MAFEIPPPVDINVARVRIRKTGAGDYRIWTKIGNVARRLTPVTGGDWVPADTYRATDLGLTNARREVDFWLEGLTPSVRSGGTVLSFELDPDGAGPAAFICKDVVKFTICRIEILDSVKRVTDHVDIGNWGADDGPGRLNGFTAADQIKNDAAAQFIDLDPDRFYVRLRHAPANANPGARETVRVRIASVENPNGADNDNDTEIELQETGNDSGQFESEALLMMSPDVPTLPDDDLAVYSVRAGGTVGDDALNDRTHRTSIDGRVRATARHAGGDCRIEVPVCDRKPDEKRRVLHLHVRVFNEPFDDFGADGMAGTNDAGEGNGRFDAGEPFSDISGDMMRGGVVTATYVQTQIDRATKAWAQACIKVVRDGNIDFVDAPGNVLGDNMFFDGGRNSAEETTVLTAYNATAAANVLEVIFTPIQPAMGANAYTTVARRTGVALGDNFFVFINVGLDEDFVTLAHEIGHALTNTLDDSYDSPNRRYIFYPATDTYEADEEKDYRRITNLTVEYSRRRRTARFPIAAPVTATTGNILLQNP